MVNIKPSRVGSLAELGRAYDFCAERGIGAYGGGQTELGVGRDHIQYLAALFHPDTPNDVAPRGFNHPELPDGMPESPIELDAGGHRLPLRVIEAEPLNPGGQTALEIASRVAGLPGRGAHVARPRPLRHPPAGRAGRRGGGRAARRGGARRVGAARLQRRPRRAAPSRRRRSTKPELIESLPFPTAGSPASPT